MIKVNDTVKFSHRYLTTIGADKSISDMQGIVKEIVRQLKPGLLYVRVLWQDETELKGCLSSNLARVKDGLLLDAE